MLQRKGWGSSGGAGVGLSGGRVRASGRSAKRGREGWVVEWRGRRVAALSGVVWDLGGWWGGEAVWAVWGWGVGCGGVRGGRGGKGVDAVISRSANPGAGMLETVPAPCSSTLPVAPPAVSALAGPR